MPSDYLEVTTAWDIPIQSLDGSFGRTKFAPKVFKHMNRLSLMLVCFIMKRTYKNVVHIENSVCIVKYLRRI